jgi:tRNA-binding EMAP/Myf-like protein
MTTPRTAVQLDDFPYLDFSLVEDVIKELQDIAESHPGYEKLYVTEVPVPYENRDKLVVMGLPKIGRTS